MIKIHKSWLFKPVLVEWLDHVGHGAAWVEIAALGDMDKAAVFSTVGFLLQIEKDRIVLGSTLDSTHTISGDITVLVRSCITKIKVLPQ